MKSLKIHHALMIFLLAALALTCVISPWMALGADRFATQWPSVLPERVPFDKVFNRAFMLAAMTLFFAYRRMLFPAELKPLLMPGFQVAWRNLLSGFGLAFISMVLLVVAMTATDVFTPYFRVSFTTGLARFAGALSAGIFAGFLEEVFFRGILFYGLLEQARYLRAYVFANLFYSAIHFVKPGEDYFLNGVEWLAGFRHLATTFHLFLDPLPLMPGIIGLFLLGVVLSYALARTGNLYLSIGLHAGWVFSLKMIRVFGNFTRQDLGWAFGSTDPKIVSGVVTWVGILLVGLAVSRLTRRSAPLSAGPPPATAA